MKAFQTHLLSTLASSRDTLVRESTDIAFAAGDTPIAREDVEQMMRACVAIIEEGLAGESNEVRRGFLEVLPDVAHSTTWDLTVRNGLPCWGVLMGKLVAAAAEAERDEAIVFLSQLIGSWWADVSKAMLPVHIAEGSL